MHNGTGEILMNEPTSLRNKFVDNVKLWCSLITLIKRLSLVQQQGKFKEILSSAHEVTVLNLINRIAESS